VRGQQPSKVDKKDPLRVVDYNGDMAALLASLADTYEVTLGFETVPQHPQPRLTFQVYDATRDEVFDAIARAAPEYQWRERNGVIEFLPVAGASFLDTPIGALNVTDAIWPQAILSMLSQPDVRTSMLALGLTAHLGLTPPVIQEPTPQPTGKRFTLQLTNATVRDALNQITARSGAHFWISQQTKGQLSLSHSNFR
jgi:hypothetical protein